MPNLTIKEIEAAIISTLRASTRVAYINDEDIRGFEGVGERETIDRYLTRSFSRFPAILVVYGGATGESRDTQQFNWTVETEWGLIVADKTLRGTGEAIRGGPAGENPGAYRILDDLFDEMVGNRFGLPIDGAEYLRDRVVFVGGGIAAYAVDYRIRIVKQRQV